MCYYCDGPSRLYLEPRSGVDSLASVELRTQLQGVGNDTLVSEWSFFAAEKRFSGRSNFANSFAKKLSDPSGHARSSRSTCLRQSCSTIPPSRA